MSSGREPHPKRSTLRRKITITDDGKVNPPIEICLDPISVPSCIPGEVRDYFWALSKHICCLIGALKTFQDDSLQANEMWKLLKDLRSGYDGECTICKEKFVDETTRFLPCGHVFHVHCIETWGREHGRGANRTNTDTQDMGTGSHDAGLRSTPASQQTRRRDGRSRAALAAGESRNETANLAGDTRIPCPCCKYFFRFNALVKPFNAFPKKEDEMRFTEMLERCLQRLDNPTTNYSPTFGVSRSVGRETPQKRRIHGLNSTFQSVSYLLDTLSADLKRYAGHCFNFGAMEDKRIREYKDLFNILQYDRDFVLASATDIEVKLQEQNDIIAAKRNDVNRRADELEKREQELLQREGNIRRSERNLSIRRQMLSKLEDEVAAMKVELTDHISAFNACHVDARTQVIDVDAMHQTCEEEEPIRLLKRRRT